MRGRVRKAVIPAAGHGTRLLPLTFSQPKEMLACGRLPVIGYVLDELRSAGIKEILLISRLGKPSLEEYVFAQWPGAFLIRQEEQLGLGHAVSLARSWIGEEAFVVALGDTIIQSNRESSPLSRLILQREAESSIVLVREVLSHQIHRYGIVDPITHPVPGEAFSLRGIIEKPDPSVAPSNLAVAGRYVFSHRVFRCLEQIAPSGDGEIQLTDAMRLLCDNPGEMCAASLLPGERRFDIGNFDSYFEAFNALAATSHLTN